SANFGNRAPDLTWETLNYDCSPEAPNNVRIILYPTTCKLVVTVRDSNGAPLSGLNVSANYYQGTATTNNDGRCLLERLPPTQIHVRVGGAILDNKAYYPTDPRASVILVEGYPNEVELTLQQAASLILAFPSDWLVGDAPIGDVYVACEDGQWSGSVQ